MRRQWRRRSRASPPQNVHATSGTSSPTPRRRGAERGRRSQREGCVAGGRIVVGAHYDTWCRRLDRHGSGIVARGSSRSPSAACCESVRPHGGLRRLRPARRSRCSVGYNFLRKHRIVNQETNQRRPEPRDSVGVCRRGRARVRGHPFPRRGPHERWLSDYYSLYATMGTVPQLFGGIIPTDIQASTAAGSPPCRPP